MSSRRWILLAFAIVLGIAAASAVAMILTDEFGVFRNPAGRQLPVYYAERAGKYLLSAAYVPANFDALLIGPSMSLNWRPSPITRGTGLRMYNESIEGGNATEEKLIVERALPRGHFRVALVVLYPRFVVSHDYQEGLDHVRWTEALGSVDIYAQTILAELTTHHAILTSKQDASPDGSRFLRYAATKFTPNDEVGKPDPVAVHDLVALARELEERKVRLVYVLPPICEPLLAMNEPGMARFAAQMKSILPRGSLIDLQGPEYRSLRAEESFLDGVHLTSDGSILVSDILNVRLREAPAQ
jgi:hypothetical protein